MVPGLAGVILPLFPGVPYMWLVALIFGMVTRFSELTLPEFGMLSALAALSLAVDYFSGVLGAKLGGASMRSLSLGLGGLMLGIFLLPPFGGIVGLFLGILIGEIREAGDRNKAIKAATGGLIGVVAGSITNLAIGIWFIGYFVSSVL